MLKRLLSILLGVGLTPAVFAQQLSHVAADQDRGYAIKGAIAESGSAVQLETAAVCVLNAADSTLVKFVWTTPAGTFLIDQLPAGQFILLASYPGYADYVEVFQTDPATRLRDVGTIRLFLKSKLLAEVVVKGNVSAIRLRGDTTEYNAGAFKIQPNAKVEDLIRQLPGLQVDKDGKITAMGQSVNKVLVDGEEFFGDDPTLVTRNIRADMVDKVQLYDRKSDRATFTGIDDGKKEKTLNIQLKEDKKHGYFGKVQAGAGTDGYYNTQAMFNSFNGKRKLSAYGTLGNTGEVDLGWQDNGKYASSNIEMQGEGILIAAGGWDELESFDGRYDGVGIPTAKTGGLHYDNKWNNDKQAINGNYKIGALTVEGRKDITVQNNLPGGVLRNSNHQEFDNSVFRQKMNVTYEWRMDSLSSLKLYAEGSLKDSRNRSLFNADTRTGDSTLLNRSDRTLQTDGDQELFNAGIFYSRKLNKPGRTLSAKAAYGSTNNDATGFLYSAIAYFNPQGEQDSVQLINQYKTNHVDGMQLNGNVTYTEPLSPAAALLLSYGLGVNNGAADRKSYNQSAPGKYDDLDSLYSNSLELDQFYHQGGVTFNYKKGKTLLNFGTQVTTLNFRERDLYSGMQYDRNFLYFTPQVNYRYEFSREKNFRFGYQGSNTLPTIDQVQPIRINNDPLNIIAGNPDLRPSFNNRFDISYRSIKASSMFHFFVNGGYSFTAEPIVNDIQIDAAGRSIYQFRNLDDKFTSRAFLFLFAGKKLRKIDADFESNFTVDANNGYSFVNGVLNKVQSNAYSFSASISKQAPGKYSVRASASPSYTVRKYSLEEDIDNSGWGFNTSGAVSVMLPLKFEINTDISYQYMAGTFSFSQPFERLLWNAAIRKKFLKGENLQLALSANDLLNRNVGFNRDVTNNMITQTSYNTIMRYFMLSVIWDFNKTINPGK